MSLQSDSVPGLMDKVALASQDLQEARNREHLRNRIDQLDGELREALGELARVARFRGECEDNGVPVTRVPAAAELTARLTEYRGRLASAPEQVANADDLAKVFSHLRSTCQQRTESIRADWRRYCEENVPRPQTHYLNLLERSPETEDQARHLRSIESQLQQTVRVDPLERTGVPQLLLQLLAEREEQRAALNVDDLPSDVSAFIDEASRFGAPLQSLTPEIRDWLVEHDLIGGYVVVPSSE